VKGSTRAVVLTLALAAPALSLAAGKPADPRAKPSSFAPRPSNGSHVYGAPIDPPLVGRASVPHAEHAPPARTRVATTRNVKHPPAHNRKPKSGSAPHRPQPDG